ncbi:hypothetical protein M405DRAFT_821269 [Rhizopogon salebrosus TDB-379]|nr:hypothetical protein M405DRAFT_821269 [Rhizopogon salebrosus TDB-379]
MDHATRVQNCLPPCNQGSPSACMSSERIAPMQTLHDFRRMAMIYKTLPRLCDIRPGVPLRV